MPKPAQTAPGCARCGYDVAPIAGGWADLCPLRGVCPECGLAFDWVEVLAPDLVLPRWHVEHPFARPLAASVSTLAHALLPRRFHAAVRPDGPRRFLKTVPAVLFALAVIVVASAAIKWTLARLGAWIAGHGLSVMPPQRRGATPLWPTDAAEWDAVQAGLLTALFPAGAAEFFTLGSGLRGVVADPAWLAPDLALLAVAAAPAVYLAVPRTLARARVRPLHLARAWLWSLPVMLVWIELAVIAHRAAFWLDLPAAYALPFARGSHPGLVLVPWTLLGLWLWWAPTNARHLRLPRPKLITAAMLLVTGLAVAASALHGPNANVFRNAITNAMR